MGDHDDHFHGNLNNLPPGFRFNPTDEELVVHFLYPKASKSPCHPIDIPDLDLLSSHPWELDGKALSSENKWYFFTQMSENRATQMGYWKQIDFDDPIIITSGTKKVGIKKYFVFCIGEDGTETNWLMQEYHLMRNRSSTTASSSYKRTKNKKLDCSRWVLCRVYERKGNSMRVSSNNVGEYDDGVELSCMDEIYMSIDDDLDEVSLPY